MLKCTFPIIYNPLGIMGGASCPSEVSKKVMNILNLKDITVSA